MLSGNTYKDCSTAILIPTRGQFSPALSPIFMEYFLRLKVPVSQKRDCRFVCGHETGKAYDEGIKHILSHPVLSKYQFIMTIEDDNLIPPDAHVKMLEILNRNDYIDAVSGLYMTKGEEGVPIVFGHPEREDMDFNLVDIRNRLNELIMVNLIPMGCALWRLDLFRDVPAPWFETVNARVEKDGSISHMTQDVSFAIKAKLMNKQFAVHTGIKVGHFGDGVIYWPPGREK